MEKKKQRLAESLLESLSLTWDMYDDAIKEIPDEHWSTGEIDYLIPARLIYHVLEAADYYTRPTSEGYPRGTDSEPTGSPLPRTSYRTRETPRTTLRT